VIEPFEIALRQGSSARAVRLERPEELEEAVRALGLTHVRASLVLTGGADGMSEEDHHRLRPLFDGVLAELASQLDAAVLDGGTDTGVMRLMGRARAQTARDFPLVGVLPWALAAHPGEPARPGAAELEPNHTHFVLVPGDEFGEESPWLVRLGDMVGNGSVTVLVNGGDISLRDAELCVAAGRPLVVVDGSGRAADRIAAAAAGRAADEVSERIARTGLVRPVDVGDGNGLAVALETVVAGRG
jgi:hypothetical protein